ncbi:MAG: hypothetical protein AAFZ63_20655 [Bacteroidota bacterium]
MEIIFAGAFLSFLVYLFIQLTWDFLRFIYQALMSIFIIVFIVTFVFLFFSLMG